MHMTDKRATRTGFAVIGFGLLLDLVAHGAGDPVSAQIGHVVVIVGMVLSLVGVVLDGARMSRLPVDAKKREVGHALR
jgi:hypothetical protein